MSKFYGIKNKFPIVYDSHDKKYVEELITHLPAQIMYDMVCIDEISSSELIRRLCANNNPYIILLISQHSSNSLKDNPLFNEKASNFTFSFIIPSDNTTISYEKIDLIFEELIYLFPLPSDSDERGIAWNKYIKIFLQLFGKDDKILEAKETNEELQKENSELTRRIKELDETNQQLQKENSELTRKVIETKETNEELQELVNYDPKIRSQAKSSLKNTPSYEINNANTELNPVTCSKFIFPLGIVSFIIIIFLTGIFIGYLIS
jgi:hypothetical protein